MPYSTTPTLSVEGVHARTTELSVDAVWRIPVGAEGAAVSGQAAVETVVVTGFECRSSRSNVSTPTV